MERLQEDGYATGEIITDGANKAIGPNGKLDADAYLSVDYTPDGDTIYAGIYFFGNEQDAALLEKDWKDDKDSWTDVVGTRVYNIAGTQTELVPVIATAEAE